MTDHAPINSRPFSFDTEFDGQGSVVRASDFRPTKRAYMPSEVEARVAQARFEARVAALAEASSIEALGVAAIGLALGQAIPALTHVAHTHREQSAALALAAARVIAAAALERLPIGPLQSALETLGQEIDGSPRLVIRASGLEPGVQAKIQAVCVDAGFTGVVAFREDLSLPLAAFQLEWADGRADFDPAATAERIATALTSALASEAGHAESLINGSDL